MHQQIAMQMHRIAKILWLLYLILTTSQLSAFAQTLSTSTHPSSATADIQAMENPSEPVKPDINYLGTTRYQPLADALEGEITVRGSKRLEPMVTAWLEQFGVIYPGVQTTIHAKGSGTVPEDMIRGIANIGAMSRLMTKDEIKLYQEKKGYEPIRVRVALDALGVYVHWKNRLKVISIPEIDAIFSTTRLCGEEEEITQWKKLGWFSGGVITVHDFHEDVGSRGYFSEKTLCGGEFKTGLTGKYTTSEEMVAALAQDTGSIGYASFGVGDYKTRMLKISKARQFPYYSPSIKNIQSGKYPLSRFLYLYIDNPTTEAVNPMLYEFFKFVFSADSQNIIRKEGAVPLPLKFIGHELSKLDNETD